MPGLGSIITSGIPNALMNWWLTRLTKEQQDKYDATLEAQILEGREGLEARSRAAMDLIANDPSFKEAGQILRDQYEQLPGQIRGDYNKLVKQSNQSNAEFLGSYDKRTADYLRENDLASGQLIGDFNARSAGLTEGFGQREADVMALLEGQGDQALKDTRRTFGEQTGAAIGDLTSRGLSGSGVGASVRGGLATRESDQLARIREAVAAQKAGSLAGLRGDTLGFGERASTLGAGFQDSANARRLGAQQSSEAGRASFDAAMRGDTQAMRERALQTAYGAQTAGASNLAGFLQGQGNLGLNTFLGTTGDFFDFINGGPVQNIPPNTQQLYPNSFNAGVGLAG